MTNAVNIAQQGSNNTTFRNRIINGAMGISQRTAVNTNVAVGTGTAGTFGPDRFWGYTGTGSLWNILQVTTGVYDFPYALRLQRIAAQTSTSAVYAGQTIETNNCIDLAGQTVTLSFYATAGANYSGGAVTVQLLTGTAADQGTTSLNTAAWTGLAFPINTTFTPTTTRTKFTFTATIGSTVQEISFRFNWSGSGTAGASDYIDITGVQLEAGSTASPFENRLYSVELALCQRYAQPCGQGGTGRASSTTNLETATQFRVPMRTTPTITFGGFSGAQTEISQFSVGSVTVSAVSNSGYASSTGSFLSYTTTGATAGSSLGCIKGDTSFASAEL